MANQNLSQFGEKLFVADADHTFIWDTAASISKRVSRNSWLSGTTADFHLGLADAATAVAQTISVQSVVAGTSNTAGANLSINGSQGTGTGAGGSLLLRTAPAGSSGTAQNALVTAVAITSAGNVGIGTTAPLANLHVNGADVDQDTKRVALFQSNDSNINANFSVVGITSADLVVNTFEHRLLDLDFAGAGAASTGTCIRLLRGGVERAGIGLASDEFVITTGATEKLRVSAAGNVGIGTTSPSSKLHVAGNSSPSITVDNTLATGASQLLFKNTVVTGDTDGVFLNGSTQTGFGGAGSLNIKATTGPIAFHTASVTNALSIAQSGAATFANNVFLGGYIQIANADGRISFDGGSKVFYTAANTYIQDLYRRAGSGDPNGTVTAPVGATYNRTDGGAGTSFYVKESGTGNTGWVGK